MRIAVTYENGQIFQHFGHTEQFKVYDLEDNKIVNTQVVDTNGQGHGALAGFLNSTDIDVLICGGIGGGAQTARKPTARASAGMAVSWTPLMWIRCLHPQSIRCCAARRPPCSLSHSTSAVPFSR